MKILKNILKIIAIPFRCAFAVFYYFILFKEKKTCKDCDYMRLMTEGYDKGQWKCTASCGNDDGIICDAWFPRSLVEKWRKESPR